MINYVNEKAFLNWYQSVSRDQIVNESALLNEVFLAYCRTGKGIYTLPAAKTVTGKDESYPFTCENIGCCGASTLYVYF